MTASAAPIAAIGSTRFRTGMTTNVKAFSDSSCLAIGAAGRDTVTSTGSPAAVACVVGGAHRCEVGGELCDELAADLRQEGAAELSRAAGDAERGVDRHQRAALDVGWLQLGLDVNLAVAL